MADNNGKASCYLGVDLGGTKIRASVFNASLQVRGTAKLTTKAQRGVAGVVERVARCVRYAVDEADLTFNDLRGVGLAAPGAVDADSGTVIFAPNLDWRNVPLKKQLEEQLRLPVFVENDGNAAMLGIQALELNPKLRHALGIFVGTGIGGGLIVDGELYRGFSQAAGEVGHMVLDMNGPRCSCGRKGCFEALASRSAIFKRIVAAVAGGRKTVLSEWLGDDFDQMRSGDLRKAIRRDDKLVKSVVEEAARSIGVAVGSLVNILNPEVVVLGGGVIDALGEAMMDTIVPTAEDYAMPGALNGVKIMISKLGNETATTGGAVLVRRMLKVG